MASLANQIEGFKKKLKNQFAQQLEKVSSYEVTELEKRVAKHVRLARANFWPSFVEDLTAIDSSTEDVSAGFGLSYPKEDAPWAAPTVNVAWHGLAEKYYDYKKKKTTADTDFFFVLSGRLKEKLSGYTISDQVSSKSFGDKFTRVFGPVRVVVGKKTMTRAYKNDMPAQYKVRVTVIPFSRFPSGIPQRSRQFEREIFSSGPAGYDNKLYKKLTNSGKGKNQRPSLVPYAQWWIKTYARKAIDKALLEMRTK